ncbi:alpha/beta hydrolase [Falsibacillus pallidus]|uniref:Alpha/beta superfamily hydrolase n=1 Tax=Falsibacillus pallidus TaxID=493781 RepID=A0A370GSS6_9BACI|nr:alpha/beta hydrolase [Falsibacillus pallidus]RDI45574.1 alpha/beta superfamily hydrolase [Falsibacillus pallidus]
MLGNVEKRTVKGYKDMEVPFTLFRKDSTSLAIILPGSGYTSQAPLLHYAKAVFANKSFDVLQVNYQYNNDDYDGFRELGEAIKWDVNVVLDELLANHTYDQFYFIGKSLGTIAMSSVLNREIFHDAKAIWLTPLIHRDDVWEAMVNSMNKGLCIIGDKDPCYREERYLKIVENANIMQKLIPNVNHDLEYRENVLGSIDVLKDIIAAIEQF